MSANILFDCSRRFKEGLGPVSVSVSSHRNERREIRHMRGRYNEALNRLHLPPVPAVQDLCDAAKSIRQRPIYLRKAHLPTGKAGLWAEHKEFDLILFPPSIWWHEQHTCRHELWHILCGHEPQIPSDETAILLAPMLDPALVQKLLERSHYDDPSEREAEMCASLNGASVFDECPPPQSQSLPPEAAELAKRIEQVLVG